MRVIRFMVLDDFSYIREFIMLEIDRNIIIKKLGFHELYAIWFYSHHPYMRNYFGKAWPGT